MCEYVHTLNLQKGNTTGYFDLQNRSIPISCLLLECKTEKKTILLQILSSLYYYILLAKRVETKCGLKLVPGFEMSIQMRGKVYGY